MGFDVRAVMNAEYPTLKSQGGVDFNKNGRIDENEKLKDANHNGEIGDEGDYYAFIGANNQYIAKQILNDAVANNIATLNDKNPYVRMGAAYTLGDLKDARAVEPLRIAALRDESIYVRQYAADALEKIDEARKIKAEEAAEMFDGFIKQLQAVAPGIQVRLDVPEQLRSSVGGQFRELVGVPKNKFREIVIAVKNSNSPYWAIVNESPDGSLRIAVTIHSGDYDGLVTKGDTLFKPLPEGFPGASPPVQIEKDVSGWWVK